MTPDEIKHAMSVHERFLRIGDSIESLRSELDLRLGFINTLLSALHEAEKENAEYREENERLRSESAEAQTRIEIMSRCVRCGAAYRADGRCARYQEGCQGGVGEASASRPLQKRIEELEQQLRDSDSKVGQLTRKVDALEESERVHSHWLQNAKAEAGYDNNTSFDVVWSETLKKLRDSEARCARLEKGLRHMQHDLTDCVVRGSPAHFLSLRFVGQIEEALKEIGVK